VSTEAFEAEPSGVGLRHYADVLRRRKWIVIGITVACVAAAALISVSETPVYRAETKIVIGQGGGLVQPGFANSIQPYTATMSDLITSDIVASNVVHDLHLSMTSHDLLSKISTAINPQTAVVDVYVDDHNQVEAVRIDQQIAQVFSTLVKTRFGAAAGSATGTQPLTANVFDPAHALPGRVSPRPTRNVAIAIVLGLVLGLVAAFLREHFDRALRTREDAEGAFGLPVIGQIPFTVKGKEERGIAWSGRGEAAEAFRALRANLQYLSVQRPLRTILVTSATSEQGKTTVTANLAITIARSGASVVVVDADLRRPRLESALGQQAGAPGLTNVLVGASTQQQVLQDVQLQDDGAGDLGRLSFIGSGPLPPNPSELLGSAQMTAFLDRLAAEYDYVLVDSPPVLLVADALELARDVDGVVLVVRRDKASRDEGSELRTMVDRLGIHLVGTVLTDVEPVRQYGTYGDQPAAAQKKPRKSKSKKQTRVTKPRARRREAQPVAETTPSSPDPANDEAF
jgi:capsular exopolysaccharide synthesis family protein